MHSNTPTSITTPVVDVNVPRFNQAVVAAVTAIGFVVQQPLVVAVMFAILALSVAGGPSWAPLTRFYVHVVRPRLQPDGPTEFEPVAPPRFAQFVGATFLGVSTIALLSGLELVGWALALIVTVLAALAAATRICVGCILYERTVAR